jgi:hypothetical protein
MSARTLYVSQKQFFVFQEKVLQSRKEHEIEIASKRSELAERATRVDDREARVKALEREITAAAEKTRVEDSERREQLIILESGLKIKQDEIQKQEERFTTEIREQMEKIELEKTELRARDESFLQMQEQLLRKESEVSRQRGELEKREEELGLQAVNITEERNALESEKSRWKGNKVREEEELRKYFHEEREKCQNEVIVKRETVDWEIQEMKRAAEQKVASEREDFEVWCAEERTRIQCLDKKANERDVAVRAREKASEAEESRIAKGKSLNFEGRKVLRMEGVKPHPILKLRSTASSTRETDHGISALKTVTFPRSCILIFRLLPTVWICPLPSRLGPSPCWPGWLSVV